MISNHSIISLHYAQNNYLSAINNPQLARHQHLSARYGNVVVNEEKSEDEEINHALEHIDLGRESLVGLLSYAVIKYSQNYSLLSFER